MASYRDALKAHRDHINRLNVYPVPDGDTGTNLLLTAEAAQAALDERRAGVGRGALLYENPLATQRDIARFVIEGQAEISIRDGATRIASALDEALGQAANYVWWCPEELPSNVWLEWDFWPEAERGLCMFFFAARGRGGEDLFDPRLPPRAGEYRQYNRGAIDAFHVSYYRRRAERSRLNLCNLRKSHGFHLVASAADPIPAAHRATPPYRMRVVKAGRHVGFWIDELPVLHFADDGQTHGPLLGGGKVGFRQMAPMVGRYADLRAYGVQDPGAFDWHAALERPLDDGG